MTTMVVPSQGQNVSVSLITTFFLFDTDGNVFFDNKSVPVTQDQLMICYMLQGWPVVQASDKLNIEVQITTPGSGGSYSAPVLSLKDGAAVTFSHTASTSSQLSPVGVTVNGASSPLDVTVQLDATVELQYYLLWSGAKAATKQVHTGAASALSSFLFDALALF